MKGFQRDREIDRKRERVKQEVMITDFERT